MINPDIVASNLLGAAAGGIAAYISFAKVIAVIQTKLASHEKSCEECRAAVNAHRNNVDIHVSEDWRGRLADHEGRIYRLEDAQMRK